MEKVVLLCVLIASILAASSQAGLALLDHVSKFVTHRRNEANLLARRMIALDLDPYELRLSDHAFFGHLQSQCTLCESRECCLQDLAHQSSGTAWKDGHWREYCPNALALEMLAAA